MPERDPFTPRSGEVNRRVPRRFVQRFLEGGGVPARAIAKPPREPIGPDRPRRQSPKIDSAPVVGQRPALGGPLLPTVNVPFIPPAPTPPSIFRRPVNASFPIGGPLSVSILGSRFDFPIGRTIFGKLFPILPDFKRTTVTIPSIIPGTPAGKIEVVDWCKTFGLSKAQCGFNLLANVLLQAVAGLRIPFGTVSFFPGKFPIKKVPRKTTRPPPVFVPVPGTPAPAVPKIPANPTLTPVSPPPAPSIFPAAPELPLDVPLPSAAPAVPKPALVPEILPVDPSLIPSKLPLPSTATPATVPPKPPLKAPVELLLGLIAGQLFTARGARRGVTGDSALASLVGTPTAAGQIAPFASRFAAPSALPQRQRARTSDQECVEVARARRRGKCYEGFFEQLPGRTRYTRWREVNCVTRKTVRSFQ